jgi:hypothetical protein
VGVERHNGFWTGVLDNFCPYYNIPVKENNLLSTLAKKDPPGSSETSRRVVTTSS